MVIVSKMKIKRTCLGNNQNLLSCRQLNDNTDALLHQNVKHEANKDLILATKDVEVNVVHV